MNILEFQDVSFKTENRYILKDISLCIDKKDFISVVGPSGSGKSTFLKLCSNLISPSSGNIFFEGKNFLDYSPIDLRKNINYCFQNPYLFSQNVMDNMEFVYNIRNLKPDLKRINSLFKDFHMSLDYLKKNVQNLSGGEKQRIAIIRSLLFLPKILLLDEITSALDEDNAIIVEDVISKINKEGTTILWITHNPDHIKRYANKVLKIENGKIKSFEELKNEYNGKYK